MSYKKGRKYLFVKTSFNFCRVMNPARWGKYGDVGFCSGAQECARRLAQEKDHAS